MELENSIDNLPKPSEEDIQLILNTINKVAPLDADILGETQVKAIIKGRTFGEVDGGRHLGFSAVIGLIASIATIAQCSIEAIKWGKKKLGSSDSITPEMEQLIKSKLLKEFESREDLKELLKEKPELLDEIIAIIK